MNRRDLLVAAISVAILAGCSESTVPDVETFEAEPITPLVVRGLPESSLGELPAVRVYRASDGSMVEGRIVVFALQDPDGVGTAVSVATDAAGIARLPEWRLGRAAGRYTATAVTEGWPPIVFTVLVRGGVVAVFDLLSVDGQPVPVGGLIEGHYILYEDGTYNRGYNRSAESLNEASSFATYTWVGGEIRFYIDAGSGSGWPYKESGYQFSHGLLSGDRMSVGYTNWMDFGFEVYSLRPRWGLAGEP